MRRTQNIYHVIKVIEFERNALGFPTKEERKFAVFITAPSYDKEKPSSEIPVFDFMNHYFPHMEKDRKHMRYPTIEELAEAIGTKSPEILQQHSDFNGFSFSVFSSRLPEYLPGGIFLKTGPFLKGFGEKYCTLSKDEVGKFGFWMEQYDASHWDKDDPRWQGLNHS